MSKTYQEVSTFTFSFGTFVYILVMSEEAKFSFQSDGICGMSCGSYWVL